MHSMYSSRVAFDGVTFAQGKSTANITLHVNYVAQIRTLRANSPDYDSICVYNVLLHLHICIFACMQIVPGELRPPRNLYAVMCTRENDDAKGLIAGIGRMFIVYDTSK